MAVIEFLLNMCVSYFLTSHTYLNDGIAGNNQKGVSNTKG